MGAMVPVPRSWSELTPSFMTAALARRCPGAVVAEVDVGPVADGTNRRASVRLRYAAGEGPPAVFVKTSGRALHRLALLALGALENEARLAEAGITLPLEHPRPFAGGVDRARLAAVVVSEDVTHAGGRPNEATRPLRLGEVRHGLEGLARLHAAFGGRPLPGPLGFLRHWRLGPAWAPLSGASLWRGLRRLEQAGVVPSASAGITVSALERQFRASSLLAAVGPQTLLHGDPHPGNTYALAGERTGFLDWQLVRRGHWSHDVGYFLVGSLEVADRRAHERDLLAHYLEALRAAGAESPPFPEALERYRATPAFGLATWLHTLAAGSFQPAEVCTTTAGRFLVAYEDLETNRSLVAGAPGRAAPRAARR